MIFSPHTVRRFWHVAEFLRQSERKIYKHIYQSCHIFVIILKLLLSRSFFGKEQAVANVGYQGIPGAVSSEVSCLTLEAPSRRLETRCKASDSRQVYMKFRSLR